MSSRIFAPVWVIPAFFGQKGQGWAILAVIELLIFLLGARMAFWPQGDLLGSERFIVLGIAAVIYVILAIIYYRTPTPIRTP
ncbi:MAG TPA: hypothetical protein VGE48_01095 [Candidatus Paceibacterota bacterium]